MGSNSNPKSNVCFTQDGARLAFRLFALASDGRLSDPTAQRKMFFPFFVNFSHLLIFEILILNSQVVLRHSGTDGNGEPVGAATLLAQIAKLVTAVVPSKVRRSRQSLTVLNVLTAYTEIELQL